MLSTAVQTIMFLSSFSPLFIMFGMLDSFGTPQAQWTCYGLAGVSVACLFLFFGMLNHLDPQAIQVDKAKPRDSDTTGYVVTYLVPFLTLNTTDWAGRLALVLFVVVVGVLYVRSHIFYVNPLLSMWGYRLFEIEAGKGFIILMTWRSYLEPGIILHARRMSDYVYFERKARG